MSYQQYGNWSRSRYQKQISDLKSTATQKQVKYYIKLRYLCKEHNIPIPKDQPVGRTGFFEAISAMVNALREVGVPLAAPKKEFSVVACQTTDWRGEDTTVERINHSTDFS